MFGGLFTSPGGERKLNGNLYYLPFGAEKVHRWKEIFTIGKSPEARFHHAMHYFEEGNYMVLLGGRRLANPAPNVILESEFVDEICLLKMDTMEWKRVKHAGDSFPRLYNYSSTMMDNQILIFGGMDGSYSLSKILFRVSLPTTTSIEPLDPTPL